MSKKYDKYSEVHPKKWDQTYENINGITDLSVFVHSSKHKYSIPIGLKKADYARHLHVLVKYVRAKERRTCGLIRTFLFNAVAKKLIEQYAACKKASLLRLHKDLSAIGPTGSNFCRTFVLRYITTYRDSLVLLGGIELEHTGPLPVENDVIRDVLLRINDRAPTDDEFANMVQLINDFNNCHTIVETMLNYGELRC